MSRAAGGAFQALYLCNAGAYDPRRSRVTFMIRILTPLLLLTVTPDAGSADAFGARKGGGGQLVLTPSLRVPSSWSGAASFSDAGYDADARPSALSLTAVEFHVFASEELGPDALRKLARPGVTLWLDTATNMLRDSTLEVLRAHQGPSFARLKAPVLPAHQRRFDTLRTGLWVDAAELSALSLYWRGARPLAVEATGHVTATLWADVQAVRPGFVFWARPGCEEQAWTAARRISATTVSVDAAPCPHAGAPVLPSYRGSAPSTAARPFIWIRPDASLAQLRELLQRHPAARLLVSVNDRPADARKLSVLLDARRPSDSAR